MAAGSLSTSDRAFREITQHLSAWDRTLRLQQSAIWLPRGLAAGVLAALVLALAARRWPLLLPADLVRTGLLLALTGALAALAGVWLWRRAPIEKARRFDRAFGLKERMSAALELATGAIPTESAGLARAQAEQALLVASQVQAGHALPAHADGWAWLVALALAGVTAAAILIPNPQEQILTEQAEVEQAIADELENLERIRERVLADPSLTAEEQQDIIDTLDQAIETLSQSEVTQEEALAALGAAEQQLRDLSEQAAADQQEALQQASGQFAGEALRDVQEALAEGDLRAAAEALANLDPNMLSPEEQQALAEALANAAGAVQESNPDLAEALESASEALESGDAAAAQEALQQAAGEMNDAAGGTTAQVEQFAEELDKSQAALSEAGQGPGSQTDQPGQDGMGQAGAQQPGQGQLGQGSHGAGRGEDEGAAESGTAGGDMSTDNNAGDGGETPYDDIYSPQRIGGEGGENVDIPGSPGAGAPTGNTGDFAENPTGQSTVPYQSVYGDYAGAANEAIDNGYVPLGLRNLIRSYFSGLDPAQ